MRFFHRGTVLFATCLALAACAHQQQQDQPGLTGEPRLHLAQAAEESGDFALAEQMYAAASSAAPADAAVQLGYADVLVRRGKLAQARNLLTQHLGTVSEPQRLRDGLGSIDVVSGDPAHAIAEFDAGLAANPRDLRALVNKGVALDMLRRHDEAQSLYRQALAIAPDDPAILNNLALSLVLAGRSREAAAVVAPLANQSDVPPKVRAGMGVVLAASGDLAAAQAMAGDAQAGEELLELSKAATAAAPH
jgi:Flp pilus assembly protein TadD